MTEETRNIVVRYCWVVLGAALVIGGGTVQGLWSDQLLLLMMVPAIYLGFSGFLPRELGIWLFLAVLGVLAILVIQFLPIGRTVPPAVGFESFGGMLSGTPQRSLEQALFAIPLLGLFLTVRQLSESDQSRLTSVIFIGLALNLVVALFELSGPSRRIPDTPLPFDLLGGLFANPNHFAALLYVSVPLLAWRLVAKAEFITLYWIAVIALLCFQFIIGTSAGMALTLVLMVAAPVWLKLRRRGHVLTLGLIGVLLIVALGGALVLLRDPEVLESADRIEFARVTMAAIRDYLPLGSGLGSFVYVYPGYPTQAEVSALFVNHAHNDYLELVLEAGLLFVGVFALYLIALARSLPKTQLQRAALLGILALLVHSVADYPLRTVALAAVFAVLNGIVFRSRKPMQAPEKSG